MDLGRIRRRSWLLLTTVLALAIFVPSLVPSASAAPARTGPRLAREGKVGGQRTVHVRSLGKVNVRHLLAVAPRPLVSGGNSPAELYPANHDWEQPEATGQGSGGIPTPRTSPVSVNMNPNGWEGLDHADQRFAGGGNQFSLEPPDQGLCVGNVSPNGPADGIEVVELVNDAMTFYDSTTHAFGVPLSLSEFFGLPPTIDRSTGTFGPFESDPKCYFDTATQRWFVTMLVIAQDPTTGELIAPAETVLAVSTSPEALGSYYEYSIDATDVAHAGCPCFGDQPLIGADQNGFYISTAEYALDCFTGGACAFNGPQIFAIDKIGLENGSPASAVHFDGLTHVAGGRTTGTVQPSTTPNGVFDATAGGTEYLMSGFDCTPAPGCPVAPGTFNEITVWAITNTSTLATATPTVNLSLKDLASETWGTPVGQTQPPGPNPLGQEVGEAVLPVNANDSRMNQVVFANGTLWAGVNTIANPGPRDGIAWFNVRPGIQKGTVNGTIAHQGYVAASDAFLSFPSIGVGDSGRGVIAFTLMGPRNYPSAAQVTIGPGGTGPIQIVQPGQRPYDGFGCYPAFGYDQCRWGDYSASVATPDGTVYSAVEMISNNERSYYENWSTFIWPATPSSS